MKALKSSIKLRKQIKIDAVNLDQINKFATLATYGTGDSFGELSLLFDAPRALSIAATRNSVFLTIKKSDYNHYLKRFEKK